jgi:aryl-alcohol dehydrogenase-like predicted oxidoreductase
MSFVNLGASGLKVSDVCLGTMTFGRETDEKESFAIMDYFVEGGRNFLDTANAYSVGKTEEVVGRWLKARGNRDQIVLATKVYGVMGDGPNDRGLSRIHIHQAIEASLRRLGTDVIDLYQIHRWDPDVPAYETLRALDDLVRQGKVRYIGCSNVTAWQLARFLQIADHDHLSRFVSLQPIYNAISRAIESELLPFCEEEGIGVISYNPLGGGFLTGKYSKGKAPSAGTRLGDFDAYHKRYYTDQALETADRFVAHAKTMGVTPAQLALAWVRADPRITSPIVGARTLEQLQDSLGGMELTLSPEERDQIPAVPPGRWVGVDPVYDRFARS